MSCQLPSPPPLPDGDASTAALLESLREASIKSPTNPKPLIRSTEHSVPVVDAKGKARYFGDEYRVTSWKTAEFAYRKAASVGVGKDLPTLARGLFTLGPTETQGKERILVRGYDKFFNVGEMGWTKPASIERYSCPPYYLTFKENGCIIFISALSPHQLIVTSKHALDGNKTRAGGLAAEEDEVDEIHASDTAGSSTKVTHAGKGEEWLGKHLSRVGKTKIQLAAELWKRGETAVAELCDDTFEEHVLAYPPEKSGLHLHGLNTNSADFYTRSMEEVDEFAHQWGFIPTRYITLGSMQEVKEFTDRIGTTGEWKGEAIEGFVVRTRIPDDATASSTKDEGIAAPPYARNHVWFYKVKYDEPYLIYRDWRELAKKMLTERTKWERESNNGAAATGSKKAAFDPSSLEPISAVGPNGQPKSKNQLKREKKARGMQIARQTAAASAGAANLSASLPEPPRARSNRPETKLFIQWCYERMYGSSDGKVKPNMTLFQGINVGKGIIHLRDTFLRYLESTEGRQRLEALGGAQGALAVRLGEGSAVPSQSSALTEADAARAARPFTHLLLVPIAVPGCGKTALFVALRHLFPGLVAHTQSDDVKSKKTAPQFLKNICEELSKSRVVLADRNNHLLKHRDEIVEAVRAWEERGGRSEEEERAVKKARHMANKKQKLQEGATTGATTPTVDVSCKPRVKIVALAWSLELLPLNTLHRLMADRIVRRGSNHQSLVADTTSAVGARSHETILWRFLEDLETLGHAEGKGEGDRGRGDAAVDRVMRLNVETSQEEQLQVVCDNVILKETKDIGAVSGAFSREPTEGERRAALDAARDYKVDAAGSIEQQRSKLDGKKQARTPRYYGLAVELDLTAVIAALLSEVGQDSAASRGAAAMFAELRSRNRINPRPHITLVHSTSLKVQEGEGESAAVRSARRCWDRYTELVAEGTVEFAIELGNLAYDDRVMAFSIKSVYPVDKTAEAALSSEEFWELQGGRGDSTSDSVKAATWHPHITVGTMDESIRPYEANGVMRAAEARGPGGTAGKVHLVEAPKTVRAVGRLSGMWS